MTAPKTSPIFNTLYKKLNAAQKEAVDTIEGPVMVVAGPGTGKTQILTLRIANILRTTDTPPEGILALTFTEAAAAHMRRRLTTIIGSAAYRVRIHTFHGFCNDVIQRYPEEFPRIIGAQPITDIEKIGILRGILDAHDFEYLKPYGDNYYYVNALRGNIGEMKRENVSPEKLESYLVEREASVMAQDDLYHTKGAHKGKMKSAYETELKRIKRTSEMLTVYREYEAALRELRRYDFEDMVLEVVGAMESNDDLALRLQEEHLYILADEHQDANTAQNRLLELLSAFHESPNLFVVGDEKQAIFRFQGASLENFLYFQKKYEDAKIIRLTDVYRSGQKILDVAHSLIVSGASAEEQMLREKLLSKSMVEHATVEMREFETAHDEHTWLANAIERQIGEGIEPSDIAVLYRTNGEAEQLARVLESRGISVEVESDQNALMDPEIRKLIVLIRALAHFGQDERLSAALHLDFLGISPLDFYKMARYAQKEHMLIADVMRSEKYLKAAKVDDARALLDNYRQLEHWARGGESVLAVVDSVVRDSGFLAHMLNTQRAVELIEKLAGLMRDIQTLAAGNPEYTLADLSAHIALLEAYRIPVRKELRAAPRKGAVRLMTAHKSKGLEFEYVYVVHVADGVWGGRRESKHFALPAFAAEGSDDDERRLLYVALTRAKQAVCVSYASERADGKAALPSRLLEMIDENLIEHKDAPKAPPQLLVEQRTPHATLPDKAFLNELFVEQGLSVTALNNYLACPWNYFYSNLVRIPKMPNKHMLFGTAVHVALRQFFESYRDDAHTSLAYMLAAFEEAAKRLPFHNAELEESLTRGREFLTGWYDARKNDWSQNLRVEYRITTELPLADGPVAQVRLRGDLDKIDINTDGSVRVTDYKTGKPKTRNAIMGLTKTDDGGYWRQLIFYKMLLELEGKYRFHDAVLDFVQPDTKGRYKQEQFFVTDEHVAEMRDVIARVSHEIYELTFWDTRCDKKECEYCALRDLMK